MVKGYAIKRKDEIDLATVGHRPTAAKVNWLWVNGYRLATTADEPYEKLFEQVKDEHDIECIEVEVREVGQ